jgi:hypothetical protein
MKTLSEIRQVKKVREAAVLDQPGVTGMDIGYKYVGGEKTDVLAIRVYVAEKKDVKDIPKSEMIPKTMRGVKTDVIRRKFVLHPLRVRLADLEVKADTGTYDPLQGGMSIGPCRSVWCEPPDVETAGWYIFVGTLGAIVTDNVSGDHMLLSNFHVMCVDDGWSVGDAMAQPSRVDGGSCPADVVGELQRAVLDGGAAGGGPGVDCAVASHTARGHACEIIDIGEVTGTAAAAVDMAVRKRGRTTELTYGTVDTIDLSVRIPYGNGLGEVTLFNQIGIEVDPAQSTQFGDHGDSGSVVVNDERKVVGLYFAGDEDGTYGVANPIQAVLDALNVSICVPTILKKVEVKEKIEKWELKEKLEKWESKEKPEKREIKEKPEKREIKEKPEKWESKEKPEHKEIWEGFSTQPTRPIQPGMGAAIEERLARLEAAVAQMRHFIGPELRPDLGTGALKGEPDLGSSDLAALSQKLQKQAADAKQAKDNKDAEKLSER